jgi:hypothetical protein
MKQVLVPHPSIGLPARFALFARLVAGWHEVRTLCKVFAQVLSDEAALDKDGLFFLPWERDANRRRLAEGVYLLKLGRGEPRLLVAVEENDFIVEPELF